MNDLILEMHGISKSFPGVKALEDVTVLVRKGEIHGLIGENGAGKSTLMKILMGIYRADEGRILIEGREVRIGSPKGAIELGIGMVPQELNLNPFVSAAENIFLGNEIKSCGKINWGETNRRAVEIMNTVGLEVNPKAVVNTLSSAQQQLVQLARVLTTGAKILIFDEPTASLTSKETDTLLRLMEKLAAEGKTIIFITHHLEELLSVTDKITVLRDGRVVSELRTSEVDQDRIIEDMAGKKMAKQSRIERRTGEVEQLRVEDFSCGRQFQHINFSVMKGEIFGIGGLIGAGRTELISSIFGIHAKDSGKVFIGGKEVHIKDPYAAVSLGMGFLPEERRLAGIFPVLSVQENMVVPMYGELFRHGKINYRKAKKVAEDYVKKIEIRTPSVNNEIKSLSGGNQQKVILARWLAKNSKIIFMDEPTRGIDVNAKAEIYDLIRQMTDEGVTVIVVSSEHEELMLLCDRIMIMHEGRQKAIVRGDEIKTSQDILKIALR